MWKCLRGKISSYKAIRKAACHIQTPLFLEAAAALPDSLFPCESVSISGSDGGFFLSFLSFFIKKCNI